MKIYISSLSMGYGLFLCKVISTTSLRVYSLLLPRERKSSKVNPGGCKPFYFSRKPFAIAYPIKIIMNIGRGSMPLYSSKGSDKNNHETRKKHQQYAEISYQFQEICKINPYLPRIFHQHSKRQEY
jgi:hypothetical protein